MIKRTGKKRRKEEDIKKELEEGEKDYKEGKQKEVQEGDKDKEEGEEEEGKKLTDMKSK